MHRKIALFWILFLSALPNAEESHADGSSSLKETVAPFFEKHCLRCHGEEKQKGDFRVDTLPGDFSLEADAERWAEVMTRLHAGEMPPEDEPQPDRGEMEAVVDWIDDRLEEGVAARMARRGAVAHYRLSREEYANTIHDLLGVRFDVHQPGAMNEDPRWHGFERIGSMLSLSPSHVDRYFRAGETVLQRAFPEKIVTSTTVRKRAIDMRHHQKQKYIEEELGIDPDRVRALVFPGYGLTGLATWWSSHIRSHPGVYRARVQVSGLPSLDGITPHLTFWNAKLRKSVFDEDIVAPEDEPVVIEFETFLPAGTSLQIQNEVSGKIPEGHHRNVLHGGGSVFTSTKEVAERMNPTGYQLTTDDGRAVYPLLMVDWIEWEGPITTEAEAAKREGLLPDFEITKENPPAGEREVNASREALRKFAGRAWRRPASDEGIERYVDVFRKEAGAGESLRSAHLSAMLGILTSKNFYYLVEGAEAGVAEPGAPPRVTDHELASRLSFFLWSSMPDDALLAAAAGGNLRERMTLKAQVERMISDPKIERFTDAFPRQWLQLHRVGMFPPDSKLYPDYDLWLEKSMVLETTGFFREVFTGNRPITEFLDSDWTMLNPRLARHYGLPPLPKTGFQRVSLSPEVPRGGLLTQGSVLSLTSDGTRHRPVHRGVWISEAIFGKTPPSPPPNVEPLEPTPQDQPKSTIRQQIEQHATNGNCASCHRKIDPYGFAFENFDAIGRWRTEEVLAKGAGENPPVDAGGTLPDGRTFRDAGEFKRLLVGEPEPFARAFVENLAVFALRRTMTIDDRDDLESITRTSAGNGYRLRDLIENLILSELFQRR